jgi:hypothetical protein
MVEGPRFGHEDKVHAHGEIVLAQPKRFTKKSFNSVSHDRVSILPRDGYTEPGHGQAILARKHDQSAIGCGGFAVVRPFEIGGRLDFLTGREPISDHACLHGTDARGS